MPEQVAEVAVEDGSGDTLGAIAAAAQAAWARYGAMPASRCRRMPTGSRAGSSAPDIGRRAKPLYSG
jgi:hypothetical protein